MAAFDALLRETFIVCAILSFPVLAVATLIGTAVAIVQAATQVQDQTLSLFPKIVAVGAILAFGGTAGLRLCAALFETAVASIPALVRGG